LLASTASPKLNKEHGHVISSDIVDVDVEIRQVLSPPAKTQRPLLKSSSKSTVKLNDFLRGKVSEQNTPVVERPIDADEPFTPEQLHLVWMDFAEQRKKFQAEFQLLIQPVEIRGSQVVVRLLSTVHETLLSNFKADLIGYLRMQLKNNSIIVVGELKESEEKQMLYTARDKFEYLLEKNPLLKTMRDRLGLDPDY
jgi:hypothetical protein